VARNEVFRVALRCQEHGQKVRRTSFWTVRGNVLKYGVSGQELTKGKNGKEQSPRAERQMKNMPKGSYQEIVEKVPAGPGAREKVLRLEKGHTAAHVVKYRKLPPKMHRPSMNRSEARSILKTMKALFGRRR